MNQLLISDRVRIVSALVEGNSMRATSRMTGVARNTINKLLIDLGIACSAYQDRVFRGLQCQRVQCDEIWSFVGAKEKNVKAIHPDGWGDAWTWVAMDVDTKLVPTWFVGSRDAGAAFEFMNDLAARLAHCVQLTTDGHKVYMSAVKDAFGTDIDYAQLIKLYGNAPEGAKGRYSPSEFVCAVKSRRIGEPEWKHISTSYIERQNLTMRMSMRRFTRLTNGFSKKLENHEHMLALQYMFYNFARIHRSLRVTPAMEAGVADHVWEIEEILALLD